MFAFSNLSKMRLSTVKADLIKVANLALMHTKVDFGIVQGIRSIEEQKKNMVNGASQIMQSKHLTGEAIDVIAYVNGKGTWEDKYFYDIAEGFRMASRDLDIQIIWGASWIIKDLGKWKGTMEEAVQLYIDHKKEQSIRLGKSQKPFIDAGHFELS